MCYYKICVLLQKTCRRGTCGSTGTESRAFEGCFAFTSARVIIWTHNWPRGHSNAQKPNFWTFQVPRTIYFQKDLKIWKLIDQQTPKDYTSKIYREGKFILSFLKIYLLVRLFSASSIRIFQFIFGKRNHSSIYSPQISVAAVGGLKFSMAPKEGVPVGGCSNRGMCQQRDWLEEFIPIRCDFFPVFQAVVTPFSIISIYIKYMSLT